MRFISEGKKCLARKNILDSSSYKGVSKSGLAIPLKEMQFLYAEQAMNKEERPGVVLE